MVAFGKRFCCYDGDLIAKNLANVICSFEYLLTADILYSPAYNFRDGHVMSRSQSQPRSATHWLQHLIPTFTWH